MWLSWQDYELASLFTIVLQLFSLFFLLTLLQKSMVGVLSNLTASAAHLKLDTSLTCKFRYLKHLFVSVRQLIINTVTAFDIITQISLYSLTTVYDFVFPVSCQQ